MISFSEAFDTAKDVASDVAHALKSPRFIVPSVAAIAVTFAMASVSNAQKSDNVAMVVKTNTAATSTTTKTATLLEEKSTPRVEVVDKSARPELSGKLAAAALSQGGRITFKMHSADAQTVQKVVNLLNELGDKRGEKYYLVVAKPTALNEGAEIEQSFKDMDPKERVDAWLYGQSTGSIGPISTVEDYKPFENRVISARERMPEKPAVSMIINDNQQNQLIITR